jgi:hypothetical protein
MDTQLHDITQLLSSVRRGDAQALEQIIPLVYGELRRLAGHYMQLDARATLCPPRW